MKLTLLFQWIVTEGSTNEILYVNSRSCWSVLVALYSLCQLSNDYNNRKRPNENVYSVLFTWRQYNDHLYVSRLYERMLYEDLLYER